MNVQNPLDCIVFVNLPEGAKFSIPNFAPDVSVPLPVRCESPDERSSVGADDLTEEALLSGILTIFAYDLQNPHLQYYRELLKAAKPNIKKELTEAAILLSKNENFALAEEIFAALRTFEPANLLTMLNSAIFFDNYADFYRRSDMAEDADAYDAKAEFYYGKATDGDAVMPDAFFNAGFFFVKKREFAKAKNFLETYIALVAGEADDDGSKNLEVKIEKANLMLQEIEGMNLDDERYKAAYDAICSGDIGKCLENIEPFLRSHPKSGDAWFILGWAMREKCKWAEGKEAFEKALECGCRNSEARNELSICLSELGDLDGAERELAAALSQDGENVKYISNLGFLALKRGDEAEARKYFLSVLEFDEKDPIAQAALASLEA